MSETLADQLRKRKAQLAQASNPPISGPKPPEPEIIQPKPKRERKIKTQKQPEEFRPEEFIPEATLIPNSESNIIDETVLKIKDCLIVPITDELYRLNKEIEGLKQPKPSIDGIPATVRDSLVVILNEANKRYRKWGYTSYFNDIDQIAQYFNITLKSVERAKK